MIQAAVRRKTGEFPRHSTSSKGDRVVVRVVVCGGHAWDLLQAQEGVQGARADQVDREVEDHLITLPVVEAHLTDQEVEAHLTILPVVEARHITPPAEGVEDQPPTSLCRTRIRHQTGEIVSGQPLLPAR